MSRRNATRIRWSLLALAGLVAAVAVGVAAASLTSSRIGLSSEPIRAGEALAPKAGDHHGRRGRNHPEDRPGKGGDDNATTTDDATTVPTTTVPTTTSAAPPPATTPQTTPSDDSGHPEGNDD